MLGTVIHISTVRISLDHICVEGCLNLPGEAKLLAIFVNESDASYNINSKFIGRELNYGAIATLFVELLTSIEKKDLANLSNIELLSRRLVKVTMWVMQQAKLKHLPVALIGTGIGVAPVLHASIIAHEIVKTFICIDGIPGMAQEILPLIEIPALFIITSPDERIKSINNYAYSVLHCIKEIKIINEDKQPTSSTKLKKIADALFQWLKKFSL